ncbi:MAG: crossover junction endodeoxyribonuclease RuvC [SAR324 cluster bacterium]|nr:crossover junction endodeoxyribonuclease RuvC [SAR324 cluster bacterium]MBF0353198.1 crossover junction endodeoxyribonuclease RuvC [SAR324 cluster bacterium]
MRIIGIDPGSRKTGYGIVDYERNRTVYVGSGCIQLGDKKPIESRLLLLSEQLDLIYQQYSPECGVVEKIFFGKNAQSALVLGHARGVILLKLAMWKLPVYEYTPLDIKKSVVGVGRATKDQVMHMVKILLNQKTHAMVEDESDALAVAITHAHLIPFLQKKNDFLS